MGLGHAVLCAASVVGDEPFAVILADDLIDAKPSALKQMVDLYEQHASSVLGVENVPRESTGAYGIVKSQPFGERVQRLTGIVEKPKPELAPSTLAVVGRYILTPRIFRLLEHIKPGAGGEIQLTDGIAALLEYEAVFTYEFDGTRYDCGSKLGYLQATMGFAAKHPEVGEAFRAYLASLHVELPKA